MHLTPSWAFNVSTWSPSQTEWCRAMALVQAEERERLGKFRYRQDLVSSLVGRLLLRAFAVSVLGLRDNKGVKFVRTERGKPVLAAAEVGGWDYNVSHAGSWVVLAAGAGARVGVDVMRTRDTRVERLEEFFRVMRRQFTEQEWACINGGGDTAEAARLARFFRHWTLKESYVKAVGTGLNLDLRTLNFQLFEELEVSNVVSSTKLEINRDSTLWKFEESVLDDEHVVSVAVHGDEDAAEGTQFTVLDIDKIFSLLTMDNCLKLESQLLRPVDDNDFIAFNNKDHPKPF